jgi:hypothetical protein
MSRGATTEELGAAARNWVEASVARSRLLREDVAFGFVEPGGPTPPEAKPVTREAWAEYKRLHQAEEEAREEFARINRLLLGGP